MKKLKKIFNVYVLICIELVISIFFISLIKIGEIKKTGLVIPESIKILPIVLFIVLFIATMLESFDKTPILKMIINSFMLEIILVCGTNISHTNFVLVLYGIIYVIVTIIYLIKTILSKKNTNTIQILPVNYTSKEHQNLNHFILVVLIILCLFVFHVSYVIAKMSLISAILLTFVFAFAFLVLMTLLTNPVTKLVRKFMKTCNYEETIAKIDSYLENSLHPDTVAYLNLIKVNLLFSVDVNKACELFESLSCPVIKTYVTVYDNVKILYHIYKNEFDTASELINHFKTSAQNIITLKNCIKVLSTKETIDNVETAFKIIGPKYTQLTNARMQMIYYYTREDYVNAKKIAEFINANAGQLKEYYIDSKLVLDKIDLLNQNIESQ